MTRFAPVAPATAVLVVVLLAGACGEDGDGGAVAPPPTVASTVDEPAAAPTPSSTPAPAAPVERATPPRNPALADSVVPIGHFDAAQSDSVAVAGPVGPTSELTEAELTYTHLGPAHFGIAISPEYPDGGRVIWSNGGDRISKLDYETLDVLAELPLPGRVPMLEEAADAVIAGLDDAEGDELATLAVATAAQYLSGVAGVYYLLDADNTLFVGGASSIVAYRDVDPADRSSAIEQRDEWVKPDAIGGEFTGANMTFDGRIAMITTEGWVVLVSRDFSTYDAVQLVGAEAAAAFNQARIAEGFRPGAAAWVRNSVAIDQDGGIYAVSADRMHKVVWNGESLSTDPDDGAWSEPYRSTLVSGSGATPSLMGFGDEDRFVVITDGEEVMNVVLYWRDEIPDGWTPPAGAPSPRIAGQLPANMGDPDLAAIQTEQSVVVGGYGALVVNNDPPTIPEGFPPLGVRALAGYAGSDPSFTPHGVQKFEWDPAAQTFREAWATREISSANSVPVVSTGSNIVYTVGARDGRWTLEGIDWETGDSAFHWVTGSSRYNSLFSGVNLDAEGRVVHTTAFGIVRYDVE